MPTLNSSFSKHKPLSNLVWLVLSLFILIMDQMTKLYILQSFNLFDVKEILPFLNLTLAFNSGAAFSFLSTSGGWQRWLFIAIAIVVCSWLIIWLKQEDSSKKLGLMGISLVIGGAVGNLWDRLVLGHVIDFIDFYIGTWHWPAFNIADSAITVGAVLIGIHFWQESSAQRDKI